MGEGALAQELQDALTRTPALERVGELSNRHRLTYEWTFLLTSLYELEKQNRDDTLSVYPDLTEYAYELSQRMGDLDHLVEAFESANNPYAHVYHSITGLPAEWLEDVDDSKTMESLVKLRKLPKLLHVAADTYYAHNGLHETAWRSGRLKAIAGLYDYHLKRTPYELGDRVFEAYASDKRLAASVHEELGTHTHDPNMAEHQKAAYRLNQEIISDERVHWYDQQKVHALFSLYDIDYRRALGPLMGKNNDESYEGARIFASASQRRFYADLYDRANYARQLLEFARHSQTNEEYTLWCGRSLSLAGTLVEIQVLGELRDSIIEQGQLLSIEARQAFLREDHNPRLSQRANPKKLMLTPNFSFDLVLQVHGARGPMSRLNIEVKKSQNPSRYLNGTYILNAKDESSAYAFCDNLKQVAQAKIALYDGQTLNSDQRLLLQELRGRIEPERQINEVLQRAS